MKTIIPYLAALGLGTSLGFYLLAWPSADPALPPPTGAVSSRSEVPPNPVQKVPLVQEVPAARPAPIPALGSLAKRKSPTADTSVASPNQNRREILLRSPQIVLRTPDGPIPGRQLAWDDRQIILMRSDGAMQSRLWNDITKLEGNTQPFQPLPIATIRQNLVQEFGVSFRVDRSKDFVVVRPAHSQRDWANSMQRFLGNIQTYFSARQLHQKSPRFPMMAVVLPDRESWLEYARHEDAVVSENYLAYYSLMSNRVVLYEQQAGEIDMGTIFHEAFHQVAFNSGIHYRTSPPPRWVAEGMATAFEAPGMYDHRHSGSRSDRWHPVYRRLLQPYLASANLERDLESLITNDQSFENDSSKAYCLSWALAFYFMEFQPQRFSNYLRVARSDEPFRNYAVQERLTHFRELCPRGFSGLARQLRSFYPTP